MEKFFATYSRETTWNIVEHANSYMDANGIDSIGVTIKESRWGRTYPQLKYYFGTLIKTLLKHQKFEWWEPEDVHRWLKIEFMVDADDMAMLCIDFYIWEIAMTEFFMRASKLLDEASTKEKNTMEFEEVMTRVRNGMNSRFKIYISKPNEPPLNDYLNNQDIHNQGDPCDEYHTD